MWLPGLLEVAAPLSWEEVLMLSSGSSRSFLGLRHPTIRHKESFVHLPSPFSCAQVINTDPRIVKALAGRVCSLQGLTPGTEMEGRALTHLLLLSFCIVPSRCTSPSRSWSVLVQKRNCTSLYSQEDGRLHSFFFFLIFIYLATPGLSCSMRS